MTDRRAPFARTLAAAGRRVSVLATMANGRPVRLSRRAPACAAQRPAQTPRRQAAPRFTG